MRPSLSSLIPRLPLSDKTRRILNRPWVVFGALLFAPSLAAAVYLCMARAEHAVEAQARILQVQLKERIALLVSPAISADAPFPERLPVDPYSVARAVEHLRTAAQSQGVNVITVSANERAASPATLGRVTLDFTLRGGYIPIKLALTEILSRDSRRVVLQQLSLRRIAASTSLSSPATGGDLEALVSISWLHRPLAIDTAAELTAKGSSSSSVDAIRLPQREAQASSPTSLEQRPVRAVGVP